MQNKMSDRPDYQCGQYELTMRISSKLDSLLKRMENIEYELRTNEINNKMAYRPYPSAKSHYDVSSSNSYKLVNLCDKQIPNLEGSIQSLDYKVLKLESSLEEIKLNQREILKILKQLNGDVPAGTY